jgi:hypothetical protein
VLHIYVLSPLPALAVFVGSIACFPASSLRTPDASPAVLSCPAVTPSICRKGSRNCQGSVSKSYNTSFWDAAHLLIRLDDGNGEWGLMRRQGWPILRVPGSALSLARPCAPHKLRFALIHTAPSSLVLVLLRQPFRNRPSVLFSPLGA